MSAEASPPPAAVPGLTRSDPHGPDPALTARSRKSAVTAAVRGVADWLGDTPAVARASYIDPRVIDRYTANGRLAAIPRLPAVLPAAAEAEIAVVALLADDAVEAAGSAWFP